MRIRKGVTFAFITGLLGIALGCGAPAPAGPTEVTRPQQSAPSPVAQTSGPSETGASSTASVGYEVGDHVPDFQMTLTNGERVTSDSLLSEGKPVFLFFMATW